jgi:hypothetical protein
LIKSLIKVLMKRIRVLVTQGVTTVTVHNTSPKIIECTNGPQQLRQLLQLLGQLLEAPILNLKD